MGQSSSFFVQKPPPNGILAKICHDKYTKENDIPDAVLRTGTTVKIIRTFNLLQSRPGEVITVSQILFPDGSRDLYPTKNLTKA